MRIKANYDSVTGEILGCYPSDVNYASIPTPNIEVDEVTWKDYINNQGKRRVDLTSLKIIAYEVTLTDAEKLSAAKTAKLTELYQSFEVDRDATTWVVQADDTKYGYDRKTDDIVNFLAAMKRAELGQETYYKVYINDINTKQMVLHTADMFHTCLGQSANEQIAAYTKFEALKAQVNTATTTDAVKAIKWS